jgi:hypothetical protein
MTLTSSPSSLQSALRQIDLVRPPMAASDPLFGAAARSHDISGSHPRSVFSLSGVLLIIGYTECPDEVDRAYMMPFVPNSGWQKTEDAAKNKLER